MPMTNPALQVAVVAVQRFLWPFECCRLQMAATTGEAYVTPPAGTTYLVFVRVTDVCRRMLAMFGCPPWELSDRWREMSLIWRYYCRCRPVMTPGCHCRSTRMERYFKSG